MTQAEEDQAAGLRRSAVPGSALRVPRRLRCIAVGSGKGGVGKTFVSVSLSHCLAKLKYKVLIFDADMGLANVDLQMGLDPKHTIQDVIFGNCSMEDAVVSLGEGPDLLPSSSGAPELVDMGDARRQLFTENLVRFAGQYDFLIIDAGAGIGKGITTFLAAAPEVLVVVANEPTSIMDAYALIKVLSKSRNPPFLRTVINMVRSLDEGDQLAARLNGITQRFLGIQLPVASVVTYDECVGNAIRARRPVPLYAANSAPTRCIEELANSLTSGQNRAGKASQPDGDFFDRLAGVGMRSTETVNG